MDSVKLDKTLILEMAQRGQVKVDENRRKVTEAAVRREEGYKREWKDLQEAVRMAFDEMIRPFVFINGAMNEHPDEAPVLVDELAVYIRVDGFAPITAKAKLKGDRWEQVARKNEYGPLLPKYWIPQPIDDYDFGVIWNWRYGGEETDDLEEALAYAWESAQEYDRIVQIKKARNTHSESNEPTYEPVEDGNAYMNELVALVRGIVDERLSKSCPEAAE